VTATLPRVLIADDHPVLRDRLATLLGDEFAVVGTASDGVQLLEAEASLHPDVLVIDITMPHMTGLEAAAQIRSRGSAVPFVCLTACLEDDVMDAAWAAGASAFVSKMSMARDLVPAVRAALAGRRFPADPVGEPVAVRK
jgi:DNA-binding NarL/FixJ family response regulator